MGADIHMMLERKTEDYGWVGLHMFQGTPIEYSERLKELATEKDIYLPGTAYWRATSRNYRLFGAIAGVRHSGPEPRGLPDDMSDLAKLFTGAWGADGHSHTWLLLDEALPIFAGHVCPEKLIGDRRQYISNDLFDVDHEELDKHRLIIFFDN